MVLMVWAQGDCFVPALLVISWLPLYHFTCGGELAVVISINFSFSLRKSARRHSQQRTVSHCLHQALDELHTPQLWGAQSPLRHVYVQKLGLNPFFSVLCQSIQIPCESQARNTDMSKEFMSKLSLNLETQRRNGLPLGRMFIHESVTHNEKEITGQRALLSYCFAVNMDYVFNRFLFYCPITPPKRKACFNQMDHTFTCFCKSKPSVHWESFYGLWKSTYRCKISTFL